MLGLLHNILVFLTANDYDVSDENCTNQFHLQVRAAVRAGAMGVIAPVDFQEWQIVPVNFE